MTKKKNTKIHLIVGVYGGIVEDTKVFKSDKTATKYYNTLCKDYNYDPEVDFQDNFVGHYILNLEE